MNDSRWLCVTLVVGILFVMGMSIEAVGQDTIKIGAVQATKGVFAEAFLHINDGLKDSLAIANLEGGINGKKLEYVMAESNYNVQEEKEKFEDLYAAYKPPVMFGASTGLGLALRKQIVDKFKVLYGSTSFSAELTLGGANSPIFLSGPSYGDQIGILLKYIAKSKPRATVAFFHSDSAFGMDGIKFGKIVAKRLRLKVVADVTVNLKRTDFTEEVRVLKDRNPDYVIFHGFVLRPVPEVIKQCRELGMKTVFMGLFWTATKQVLEKLGPSAEGYLVVNPYSYWGMTDVPMVKRIMDYNAKHYPDIKYRPNYYMQGFVTGMIFTEVLRKADRAGNLDFKGMIRALQSIKGFDTGGLTAPLTIRNNRFPVARVWAANLATGAYEPAPLPAGLEAWINVPD